MSSTPQVIPGTSTNTVQREAVVHDLRNLFGVVASATHLLEREPCPERRVALLAALEAAAFRGGQLISGLAP